MEEISLTRLSEAIDYLKSSSIIKTQKEIASRMEMNINSVSQAINGNKRYLTDSFLKKFCASFKEINVSWLLGKEDEMLLSTYKVAVKPTEDEVVKALELLILHEDLFLKYDSYKTFLKNKESVIENKILKDILAKKWDTLK